MCQNILLGSCTCLEASHDCLVFGSCQAIARGVRQYVYSFIYTEYWIPTTDIWEPGHKTSARYSTTVHYTRRRIIGVQSRNVSMLLPVTTYIPASKNLRFIGSSGVRVSNGFFFWPWHHGSRCDIEDWQHRVEVPRTGRKELVLISTWWQLAGQHFTQKICLLDWLE